jgi:hypothetical protein
MGKYIMHKINEISVKNLKISDNWQLILDLVESLNLMIERFGIECFKLEDSETGHVDILLKLANSIFSSYLSLLKDKKWYPYDSTIFFQVNSIFL